MTPSVRPSDGSTDILPPTAPVATLQLLPKSPGTPPTSLRALLATRRPISPELAAFIETGIPPKPKPPLHRDGLNQPREPKSPAPSQTGPLEQVAEGDGEEPAQREVTLTDSAAGTIEAMRPGAENVMIATPGENRSRGATGQWHLPYRNSAALWGG